MIQTYMNEEIFEKLEMSKTEVTELTLRDLRCPNCRFLIDKIYSDIRGHMQVKCPKSLMSVRTASWKNVTF